MYKSSLLFFVLEFILSFAYGQNKPAQKLNPSQIEKLAQKLAHQYPMVDGHVDLPYRLRTQNFRLQKEFLSIPIKSKTGNFDYEKAKMGGLSAPFMSIFIDPVYQQTGGARELADTLINLVQGITKALPNKFALAKTPQEIEINFRKGLISLPLGMENGAPIENDLKNVQYFFDKGVRYITLTHTKDNLICDSSGETKRTWGGLSPFGKNVVKEMNRLGMIIDISHVSDETFFQVMESSEAPCIASHSSCRAFTPDFPRNMSDEMIAKLGAKGGVIMISFGNMFLDNDAAKYYLNTQKQVEPEVKLTRIADHIDHVVKLIGIEHVGFGSDFDGVMDHLPSDMKDVSKYPSLIAELLRRGYSKNDITKIMYQNVFRVWNKVIEIAKR